MFALQYQPSRLQYNTSAGTSKIDLSFIGSQMIEGYPVVDLRRQNKPVSLKSVFDEIQHMSKGITFLYEGDSYSDTKNEHINNLEKICKCLKDEGRDYVVYNHLNLGNSDDAVYLQCCF